MSEKKRPSGANRAEHHRARGHVQVATWLPGELVAECKQTAESRGLSFREWLIGVLTDAVAK